jgi:site-specific recombinase XerD
MTARAIQYIVASYMKEADIRDASVHALRHTMATWCVARGTDLKSVQETLGHASLATTILLHLAKKAHRKAYKNMRSNLCTRFSGLGQRKSQP